MSRLKSRLLSEYKRIYELSPYLYVGAAKISRFLKLSPEVAGYNFYGTHQVLIELVKGGFLEQRHGQGFRLKKLSVRVCLYCERKFKPFADRNVTCGRESCLKARKKDYHRAYMQREVPRAKRLAYYVEYSQRPEVKQHIQNYHKEYHQRKKTTP